MSEKKKLYRQSTSHPSKRKEFLLDEPIANALETVSQALHVSQNSIANEAIGAYLSTNTLGSIQTGLVNYASHTVSEVPFSTAFQEAITQLGGEKKEEDDVH